tara:strand:- start:2041 stop:2388 length:348 start_codon:yes stop_codon:yes gene_type:complete
MAKEISLSQYLKEYVELNSKIEEYNNKIKLLRDEKNKKEARLIKLFKENKKNEIKFNNNIFTYKKTETTIGISQKLIKQKLDNYYKDDNKSTEIFDIICKNREKVINEKIIIGEM